MNVSNLVKDAVLRVGEVSEVNGRKVFITVDKNKNLSDIFFDGDILKNISVNSYIEIRKGFLSIIGKVDGEKVELDTKNSSSSLLEFTNKNSRVLSVSLSGYINHVGRFVGGTKELPLIGNEAYIITQNKIHQIHNLVDDGKPFINIATSDNDDIEVQFPIDGLFNSHIAIFGNTGSGKSNTLAILYQELIKVMNARNAAEFKQNVRFALFDFNGEYVQIDCISEHKKVYNLTTLNNNGEKIPIDQESLLDIEILSILADATEKTQKPFISRTITFYKRAHSAGSPIDYIKGIIRNNVNSILQMSDKVRAYLLMDYLREILPKVDAHGNAVEIASDLDWHNMVSQFLFKSSNGTYYLQTDPLQIPNTTLYKHIENYTIPDDVISGIIDFLYLQLINDVIANRAQNEHVAPAINKLKSKKNDIQKLFDTSGVNEFWESNFVIINLNSVNLDMKKTIPLLLSKKLYSEQKLHPKNTKSLTLIIDEAHNILSTDSFREAESWKDYRLETFEEIIKEGRKFGTFVTISSQRPNDISPTITSQAHNYFIHRLINQKDLATISSAVSYIDKITEESIPTLPTGTCVFSGVAAQMPLKINIKELEDKHKPKSDTLKLSIIVPIQAI